MSAAKPSAMIRYSALRLLIFVACFFVSGVAVHFGVIPSGVGGSNVVWVVLLGLVLSAPLSYVLLRKQRDEMSVQVVQKVDRAKARLEASRAREDAVQ